MTKSEGWTRTTARAAKAATKRSSASKSSGRAVLGDVSNRRVTRSSRGKLGDEGNASVALAVPVRRSSRTNGSSKETSSDKSNQVGVVAVDVKLSSGRLKRKLDDGRQQPNANKKENNETEASARVYAAVGRSRGGTRKSDDKKRSAVNHGRSSQRGSQVTNMAVAKARSRSSKRRKEISSTSPDEPVDSAQSETSSSSARSKSTRLQTRSGSTSRSRIATNETQEAPTPKPLCADFLEHTDFGLVRVPFDDTKFTFGIAIHDETRRDDILEVSDYVTDIFQRLFNAESFTRPKGYVQRQPHLNAMMRAILIDWIVEVHMKFRLSPPTLYLCVNIIDRYLSVASVNRENLQLVGVTSLLIACKYEEIYPPEVRDCVYITDRAYSRQDVLDMEQQIVKRLEFKMTVPTGYPFLQRFLAITEASETVCMAANYYMERVLQEHEMLEYRPSLVAAAAVCLALNNPEIREFDDIDGPKPGMPELLLSHTGFTKEDIWEVATKLSVHVGKEVTTQSGRELVAVKRKYESAKYKQVSLRFSDPYVDDIAGDS